MPCTVLEHEARHQAALADVERLVAQFLGQPLVEGRSDRRLQARAGDLQELGLRPAAAGEIARHAVVVVHVARHEDQRLGGAAGLPHGVREVPQVAPALVADRVLEILGSLEDAQQGVRCFSKSRRSRRAGDQGRQVGQAEGSAARRVPCLGRGLGLGHDFHDLLLHQERRRRRDEGHARAARLRPGSCASSRAAPGIDGLRHRPACAGSSWSMMRSVSSVSTRNFRVRQSGTRKGGSKGSL